MEDTVDDFWLMIWQQGVEAIVNKYNWKRKGEYYYFSHLSKSSIYKVLAVV